MSDIKEILSKYYLWFILMIVIILSSLYNYNLYSSNTEKITEIERYKNDSIASKESYLNLSTKYQELESKLKVNKNYDSSSSIEESEINIDITETVSRDGTSTKNITYSNRFYRENQKLKKTLDSILQSRQVIKTETLTVKIKDTIHTSKEVLKYRDVFKEKIIYKSIPKQPFFIGVGGYINTEGISPLINAGIKYDFLSNKFFVNTLLEKEKINMDIGSVKVQSTVGVNF